MAANHEFTHLFDSSLAYDTKILSENDNFSDPNSKTVGFIEIRFEEYQILDGDVENIERVSDRCSSRTFSDTTENLSSNTITENHISNILDSFCLHPSCLDQIKDQIVSWVVKDSVDASNLKYSFRVKVVIMVTVEEADEEYVVGENDDEIFNEVYDAVVTESIEEEQYESKSIPASRASINGLKRENYSTERDDDLMKKGNGRSCVVCMEEYMDGSKICFMPCSHFFHEKCLVFWLEKSNSCPLCRLKIDSEF